MASLTRPPPPAISVNILPRGQHRSVKLWRPAISGLIFPHISIKHLIVRCTNVSPWEPSPVTYASTDNRAGDFLKSTADIFETLSSNASAEVSSTDKTSELANTMDQPSTKLSYMRWPLWLVGPPLLLVTGMVPTLWLPISSIFLGANIASLLSLTGLDCIFNLGASLFLLMADSCARPSISPNQLCRSQPPLSYMFWNMVATISGFVVPLIMFLGSHKGFFQTQLPFISFAVLFGPYLLLLSVQMLTEMLTWHWESPVWLVTPVVYESYRVLQLMRGLKLGHELGAPAWTVHTIKFLVCWWVLVLGVQLMRVAWYAGFTSRVHQNESSGVGSD